MSSPGRWPQPGSPNTGAGRETIVRPTVWRRVLALAGAALIISTAFANFAAASELVTAELIGTVNDVTVQQGASSPFTISLSATGSASCAITSASPSTARVDTVFALSSGGVLSAGTLSSAMSFYSNGIVG